MTHPLYVMKINLFRTVLDKRSSPVVEWEAGRQDSHQHECVKGLSGVQGRLDQVHSLPHLCLVLPCRPRQRRSLSKDVASSRRFGCKRHVLICNDKFFGRAFSIIGDNLKIHTEHFLTHMYMLLFWLWDRSLEDNTCISSRGRPELCICLQQMVKRRRGSSTHWGQYRFVCS